MCYITEARNTYTLTTIPRTQAVRIPTGELSLNTRLLTSARQQDSFLSSQGIFYQNKPMIHILYYPPFILVNVKWFRGKYKQ